MTFRMFRRLVSGRLCLEGHLERMEHLSALSMIDICWAWRAPYLCIHRKVRSTSVQSRACHPARPRSRARGATVKILELAAATMNPEQGPSWP